MPSLAELDPRTRQSVRQAALAEIQLFRAQDEPGAIERLAEAGREGCQDADVGACVSDAMDEMAADLRERQRQLAAACGALGPVVRLMVGESERKE